MEGVVKLVITGLYSISYNRRLSIKTRSYAKKAVYEILTWRSNILVGDLPRHIYFNLDFTEMNTFLGQVLDRGNFGGQAVWEFIQETFKNRKMMLDMAKEFHYGNPTLETMMNDSWELWIPVFVIAVSVTKSHEKDLLLLLLEFSQLSHHSKALTTFLNLRELEMKVMAQKACVALANKSKELRSYYVYWQTKTADRVLLKNPFLAEEIRAMLLVVIPDANQLNLEYKNELREMAQLKYMTDLRYQTSVHLLGEVAILKLNEKGLEARGDPTFENVWEVLQQHRHLMIPVPERRFFLARVLQKISFEINKHTVPQKI
ncbi:hypothetical protein CROQUDRAFT_78292 [Cronartium quercuum f. sp. fusiforme G11]|uniref:Uncharacterized protein n=1 Tax=Cronartium quercuum f. sp. fusiforme G11 TaxID=708437 RepID=A0A9P6NFD6_9BASI|nr:hypothetical protein CROQUDRAFT_78292 [Cronartium quercuum f. sp. fusiforme G11]